MCLKSLQPRPLMSEPESTTWPYWTLPFIIGIGAALAILLLADSYPALQVIYTVF